MSRAACIFRISRLLRGAHGFRVCAVFCAWAATTACSRGRDGADAGSTSSGPTRAASSGSAAAALASASNAGEPALGHGRPAADPPPLDRASGRITAGEARRSSVVTFEEDPILRPHAAALKKHFAPKSSDGGAVLPSVSPAPYAVQEVMLTAGRVAALVETSTHEQPMVLVLDASGARTAWVRERPTGGILSPTLHLALAPHPLGGAALFFFDPPTRIVGARMWAEDGDPFAELEVLHEDACDALSAAYWPGRGYVVVSARVAGARAQRIGEDGRAAWGTSGVEVGANAASGANGPSAASGPHLAAPVTIVVDTAASVMLLQLSTREDLPSHVLARRLDAEGRMLGDGIVDLGTVPRVALGGERIEARRVREGVVEVTLRSAAWTRTIGGGGGGEGVAPDVP